MSRRVLVYKSELLQYSETFIREQVLAYRRWQPVLVGDRRIHGLDLVGMDVRLIDNATSAFASDLGKWLRRFGIAPPGMVRQLADESASLFHVHFGTDAVRIWPVARHLGMPVVVTLHGYDINIHRRYWRSRIPFRNYPDLLLAMSRQPDVHFVAVSEAIRQRAIDFGIPDERISVRYIGIDSSRFSPAGLPITARRRRILFIGRLVEKKGTEFLIRAFDRVRAAVPEAELVIVGDGPLQASLRTLATQIRVPVTFVGSLPSSEVKKQIDQARVCCVPSIVAENGDAEGLAITILEAQACGVPVVTSACGGTTEGIFDGVTGFAFAEKDIQALAERLVQVLTDDLLAASMSQAAPRFIAGRFEISHCTAALEALYDDLVDRRASSLRIAS